MKNLELTYRIHKILYPVPEVNTDGRDIFLRGIYNRFYTSSFANIDKQKNGIPAGRGIESFTQSRLSGREKSGGHVFTFHNPRQACTKIHLFLDSLKARYSSNLRAFDRFAKKLLLVE